MTIVAVPIVSFLVLFLLGGVLLLLANPVLGGEANYGQMLAVTAYASLVKVIQTILTVPILLATGSLVVFGPGLLLPEEMLSTFAGRLLSGMDIFTLWQVLLMAVGTGVMAGCATRRALFPLLILWAVWIVVQAALGGLTGAMPAMTEAPDLLTGRPPAPVDHRFRAASIPAWYPYTSALSTSRMVTARPRRLDSKMA